MNGLTQSLSEEVWMRAGTCKKPRFIKVHEISLSNDIINGLLAFHAITGCDTTSQFTGIGKKSAWKVYQQFPHLLHQLGEDLMPTPATIASVEEFVSFIQFFFSVSNHPRNLLYYVQETEIKCRYTATNI